MAARPGPPGRDREGALGMRLSGPDGSGPARWPQVLDAVSPVAGDVVMALAIISVDLHLVGQPAAAVVSLGLAAGTWLFLGAVVAQRALREPGRLAREVSRPAALTGVAGSCVLGTAFAAEGCYPVAAALLGLAALAWVLLAAPVLRHRKPAEGGAYFLLTVATQGLGVLGATLAPRYGAAWLLIAAVAALVTGLALYALTLLRFDPRQLLTGHGDQRVAGGALAISVLTCVKVIQAGDALGWLTVANQSVTAVALALWCLAMLWLGPLIATEVRRPRLSYDLRRWGTGFPLGMYAACSFAVGQLTGIAGISAFARGWTWLAVAVGLVVSAGLIRRCHARAVHPVLTGSGGEGRSGGRGTGGWCRRVRLRRRSPALTAGSTPRCASPWPACQPCPPRRRRLLVGARRPGHRDSLSA